MPNPTRWAAIWICGLLLAASSLAEAGAGSVEGTVTLEDGSALVGVRVVLEETGAERTTGTEGVFSFAGVPPGTYSLTFTLGEETSTAAGIAVRAGAATHVDHAVGWRFGFADTLTVLSASRRRQRVVEAPAAVTTLARGEIVREAAGGRMPELLEFTPGAELTQSSVFEFNFNVRGMNDPFNRRLLTLVDGRDAALPSLGSQEWSGLGFPLDELAAVELVRGTGSALYGADAFNGVLSLTTRSPRASLGGRVRLTAGELETRQVDARHAAGLGSGWYFKALAGFAESEDFSRARTSSVEYSRPCAAAGDSGCLPLEAVAPPLARDEIAYGALRLDKHLGDDRTLVAEAGTTVLEGPVQITEFGRFQLLDVERPWARLNFNAPHWNVLGGYTGREGNGQLFLSNAYPFSTASWRVSLEAQGSTGFARGRGFLAGGVSAAREKLDSADEAGIQTVTYRRHEEDFEAVFGQVEVGLTDRLDAVLAARWDDSTIYRARLSPRASLVWAPRPSHTLRLSYSEAFLSPSYIHNVLYMPVAPPLDLAAFEAICGAGGVACGFDEPVALRAVGNAGIRVEQIESLELGYSAVLGKSFYLTADAFENRIRDFISDFLPFADPIAGRLHESFPAYRPPAELPPPLAALLLGTLARSLPPELYAALSNGVAGEPFFPLLSVVNFGRVDTRGLELGLEGRLGKRLSLSAGYGYFDFDVRDDLPQDPALPNAPEHKLHLGITWIGERFDAAFKARYVEAFDWSAGFYRGRVPAYGVADLAVSYRIGERWRAGVDVSNLFDHAHYELFGADLLRRRAVGHVSLSW